MFASSWHWNRSSFFTVQLSIKAEEKLFPSLHGQSALQMGAGLVPEEKQRNRGYAKKLPHEMGK